MTEKKQPLSLDELMELARRVKPLTWGYDREHVVFSSSSPYRDYFHAIVDRNSGTELNIYVEDINWNTSGSRLILCDREDWIIAGYEGKWEGESRHEKPNKTERLIRQLHKEISSKYNHSLTNQRYLIRKKVKSKHNKVVTAIKSLLGKGK